MTQRNFQEEELLNIYSNLQVQLGRLGDFLQGQKRNPYKAREKVQQFVTVEEFDARLKSSDEQRDSYVEFIKRSLDDLWKRTSNLETRIKKLEQTQGPTTPVVEKPQQLQLMVCMDTLKEAFEAGRARGKWERETCTSSINPKWMKRRGVPSGFEEWLEKKRAK
jgi:predicted RNase H-like nuclease (RuvC/YqgF family)